MEISDNSVIEKQIHIAARPEIVFSFFTDPAKMRQWKGIQATLDPKPGGIYRVEISGRDIVRGTYLEIVPFSRVVFTWGWEGDNSPLPPGSSTVEVTLTPDSTGTTVRLRHMGLPEPMKASHIEGWDHFLPRLGSAAEGQDPGPDPWSM